MADFLWNFLGIVSKISVRYSGARAQLANPESMERATMLREIPGPVPRTDPE
jgi:hypothetical protein